LQLQVGSERPALFTHCATSGALHETSQRLPLISVLHDVVELLEDVEFVVVLPTLLELLLLTELVTFVELLELTELVTFDELRVLLVPAAPAEVTFSAESHAQSASTIAVRRYLMVGVLGCCPCAAPLHLSCLGGAALAFGSGLAAHEQRETFHGFPP
jgi:hypothetical protein